MTKAPKEEKICVVISKTYEIIEDEGAHRRSSHDEGIEVEYHDADGAHVLMFSAQRRPRGVCPELISKLALRCLLPGRLDHDLILPILSQRMPLSRAAFV